MRLRSLAMSTLWIGLFVTTVMALRAADEKAKAKDEDAVPPSPGTIKFATAPAPVQKAFKDETKSAKIDLLGKSDDGQFYMAIVGVGENNYRIAVSKEGQLLEKVLEPAKVEMKLEECPPAIQKFISTEAKGGKVEGIVKNIEGKRIDFIIDVDFGKSSYQFIVTDEGTLLSKILDQDPAADQPPAAPKEEAPKGKPPAKKP